MPKILIVDDHEILRKGLIDLLEDHPSENPINFDEAAHGFEALEKIRKDFYDLIILDIELPKLNGIELIKTIKNDFPQQNILAFSFHPEEDYGLRALKAGANGYLCKTCSSETLLSAIEKILFGNKYITPFLSEKLLNSVQSGQKSPHELLSDRELEIMQLLIKGEKLQTIAKQLFLSINTVKTYNHRIYKKLNIKNKTQLIHYAVNNNLFTGYTDKR